MICFPECMKGIKMNEITTLMDALAPLEGLNTTGLQGVRIYRATKGTPRVPLLYEQGVIIVGQGSKRIYLGDRVYEYDPDHYLVLSVPIPAECEAAATEDAPFLAMMVDIDLGHINSILSMMDEHVDVSMLVQAGNAQGLSVSKADSLFKETVLRLLNVLKSPVETHILGKSMIRELTFRLLCGENAASLYALAMKNTNLSRIDKALRQIHNNYQEPMDVENLAGLVNMSVSSFHRAFKDVTASSPIQYIKKLRLSKAKDLIAERGLRVGEAATRVGYESSAQFSREFKRYFGSSPVEVAQLQR